MDLHTVEVAGSNPAAPTIESTTYRLCPWDLNTASKLTSPMVMTATPEARVG